MSTSAYDILSKDLNSEMQSITRCSQLVIQYFDGDKRKELVRKLDGLMETCCFMENKSQITSQAFHDVQKHIKDVRKSNEVDEDDENPGSIEINVRELVSEKITEKCNRLPAPRKHAKYLSYKKSIDHLTRGQDGGGDEDLTITEAEVNTVCPITKQVMVNPVRIKQCGHTFEKNSIMSLMKKRKHIKCPLPGCSQNTVTINDLEDDVILKQVLSRRATQL